MLHLWHFFFIVVVMHLPSFDCHWQSLVDFLRAQSIHNVVAQPNPVWCAESIVLHHGARRRR